MPTLEFEGKSAVYSHHLSVPYRELVPVPDKGVGIPDLDGNLIIHGDNLEALKALLSRYAGKVDVIYIDPPYNTGKEEWRYDDKVSSPMMKDWLGKIVDREDLQRHDKWLCMMWPRIQLLVELLSNTGVIFVSIDDNEEQRLKCIMDEIFGEQNLIGTIIWKSATDNNPTRIAIEHEYIVCYARDAKLIPRQWSSKDDDIKDFMIETFSKIKLSSENWTQTQKQWKEFVSTNRSSLGDLYRYRRIDENGPFVARRNLENPGKPGYQYDITHPKTGKVCAKPYWGWRFPEETMKQLLDDDRIIFGKDESKIPELKVPLREVGFPLRSVVQLDARKGSNDLERLFGSRDVFKNPKPVELIELLLDYTTAPSSIILDSFAGSGTTGHAVLSSNRHAGDARKFILVECGEYADSLTAERLRRVIRGVPTAKDPVLNAGLGGGFTYCELGDQMDASRFFDGEGAPTYEQLARYVIYTATGENAAVGASPATDWFAADMGNMRVHLIYKPDLTFMRSADAGLTLDLARRIGGAAKSVSKTALVFGAAQFVSAKELRKQGLRFVQLPWSIHQRLAAVA